MSMQESEIRRLKAHNDALQNQRLERISTAVLSSLIVTRTSSDPEDLAREAIDYALHLISELDEARV